MGSITQRALCICGDPECSIPYGYCHCGCGQKTRLARQTYRDLGWVAGQPIKFVNGHNSHKKIEDFWLKIDRSGGTDACWLWKAGCYPGGYGIVGWKGKTTGAHRVAWELTNGPIPTGQLICHRCDNRLCCNPAHLFVGTQLDNMTDCMSKGRTTTGTKNAQAKLTQEDVDYIRWRYAQGDISQRQLGIEKGICPMQVNHIVRYLQWKDRR